VVHLLREHDDFRRLWLAQTISQVGSQVTYLAIPLTAAVTLRATPAEMGVLTAMGALPALLIGVFAGAFVDRRRRRPILISADLARALVLGTIPVAWLLGALSMPLLILITLLAGAGSLFFDVAYQALLPTLIPSDRLVEGNSTLELSRSAAQIAGPTLAGGMIQLLKAPLAIAVDALSFLVSALLILRIRAREDIRRLDRERASLWADARAGVREVGGKPAIRALAVGGAAVSLFNAMLEAVIILYLTRSIGLSAGVIGVVFAGGGVGLVVGALVPGRITRRFGLGPAMALGIAVVGLSDLAVPLAGRDVVIVSAAVAVGEFFFGLGLTLYSVAQTSLRQALVPDELMGRVSAVLRVLAAAAVPLGALAGGLLGQAVGLRSTIAVAASLEAATALWVWRSPLWSLRTVGRAPDQGARRD
jgi:MFS family permease